MNWRHIYSKTIIQLSKATFFSKYSTMYPCFVQQLWDSMFSFRIGWDSMLAISPNYFYHLQVSYNLSLISLVHISHGGIIFVWNAIGWMALLSARYQLLVCLLLKCIMFMFSYVMYYVFHMIYVRNILSCLYHSLDSAKKKLNTCIHIHTYSSVSYPFLSLTTTISVHLGNCPER